MKRPLIMALMALALLGAPGCKIVYETDADETVIPDGPDGDDARNDRRIAETFEPQFLPYIRDNAVPLAELREKITADIAAAGEAHAVRGSGAGAAWNFPVSGEGTVVAAKLDTRARTLDLDTDADGSADVVVQIGPVFRGTTLRDGAPFYKFEDFRDQIEFAKLARALNDQVKDIVALPEAGPVGRVIRFTGMTPLKSASDQIVVTPIDVAFQP